MFINVLIIIIIIIIIYKLGLLQIVDCHLCRLGS